MTAKVLMIEGSNSSKGKGLMVTALANAVENLLDMNKLEKIIWES